jgi:hypothetical protein
MNFLRRIRLLYRIVIAQQVTRIILRAAWLGGAVYLICWGVNAFWSVLPDSKYWVIIALAVSIGTLTTLVFRARSRKEFLWRVDQRFDLKEQVSTAYEVSTEKQERGPAGQQLDNLLVEDANKMMPSITRKVIDNGWGIRSDVEATVIVLMMLLTVYLSGLESFSNAIPFSGLGILPGVGGDPSLHDVFPSGIPGDTEGAYSGLGDGGIGTGSIAGPQDLTPEGLDLVFKTFQEMGEELKDSAATSELGRALAEGDFEQAANEMGSLSENIDRVTAETRLDLADRFSDAVRKLYLSQFSEITEVLGRAADALRGTSDTEMNTQLDRVSAMLQSFSGLQVNDVLAREEAEPETTEFEALEGEEEELDLQTAEDISDMLIAPGSGAAISGEVEGTAVDFTGYSLEYSGAGVWSPFDFSWDDKDVVSSYFTPR